MTTKKLLFLGLAIIVALVCIGFLGIKTLTQSIYHSRSCEWANIDNIELRTLIDIPSINSCECEFDAERNVKQVIFDLNLDENALLGYAKYHHFIPIEANDAIVAEFNQFKNAPRAMKHQFYYQSANRPSEESFKMLLDPKSKKMWLFLEYHN